MPLLLNSARRYLLFMTPYDDKGKCSFHESDFTWNLLFEYWIFFNFPPLSQSFIASQLEDVNCTDLEKTRCSSVHILCTVTV